MRLEMKLTNIQEVEKIEDWRSHIYSAREPEKLGKSQRSDAFSTFFIPALGSTGDKWQNVNLWMQSHKTPRTYKALALVPMKWDVCAGVPPTSPQSSWSSWTWILNRWRLRLSWGSPGYLCQVWYHSTTTHEDRPRRITSSPPSSGQCFLEVKQRWRRHQGSKKVAGEWGGGWGGGGERGERGAEKKTQDLDHSSTFLQPSSLSVSTSSSLYLFRDFHPCIIIIASVSNCHRTITNINAITSS